MDAWFRIRHLQSVSSRNVNIPVRDLNCSSIFFALSTTDQENLGYFYQSAKCGNLLNPFWENLDLSYENIKRFSFLDNFLITFFLSKKNKNKILLEINVHISGLVMKTKLNSVNIDEDYQFFMFQFNNNWYTYDFYAQHQPRDIYANESQIKIKKKLYDLETIKKFFEFISDEKQQFLQNALIKRNTLENQIYKRRNQTCRINQKRNRIVAIKNQLLYEQKVREVKLKSLEEIKQSINLLKQKSKKTLENHSQVELDISKLNSSLKRYRDVYLKISNDYMLRLYQLIHELSKIFPITPTEWPMSGNPQPNTIIIRSSDKLSICNLHLPNSDKQIILNQDSSNFAALGMVCQLLSALSKIYDIPLRYPLISDDPKLAIRDYIIDIDDNERNFLLVKNTAATYRLQYAIYLLNLNIAAIRGYFSLSTKSPDRTLWNINTLIEGKNKIIESRPSDAGPNNNFIRSSQMNSNHSLSQSINSPNLSPSSHGNSPPTMDGFQSLIER